MSESIIFFITIIISIIGYLGLFFLEKRLSQAEREEGPKSHKKKNGTMTMGGLIFIIVPLIMIFLDLLLNKNVSYEIILVCLVFFLYGCIGFIDDYLKVVKHTNEGLTPKLKLILQIIVAAISYTIYLFGGFSTEIRILNFNLDLSFVFGFFILFVLVGASNAFNLTDGIDGLCGGLTIFILISFIYIFSVRKEKELVIFLLSLLASLLVFMYFNFPKALLFMGDTGSLALGGLFGIIAIFLRNVNMIAIIAIIFIAEALSVVMQVTYFKITKGKRIFRMAPLHHHFEECGYSEGKILYLFYGIEIFAILVGLYIGGYL